MRNTSALRHLLGVTLVGVLVLGLLAGCYPTRRSEPIVGPMTLATPGLQRGAVLFDRHCYKCHAEGEGALGPAFNHLPLPRYLIHFQVRHGLGAMPAFSEQVISDDELEDIVSYMVRLRHHY